MLDITEDTITVNTDQDLNTAGAAGSVEADERVVTSELTPAEPAGSGPSKSAGKMTTLAIAIAGIVAVAAGGGMMYKMWEQHNHAPLTPPVRMVLHAPVRRLAVSLPSSAAPQQSTPAPAAIPPIPAASSPTPLPGVSTLEPVAPTADSPPPADGGAPSTVLITSPTAPPIPVATSASASGPSVPVANSDAGNLPAAPPAAGSQIAVASQSTSSAIPQSIAAALVAIDNHLDKIDTEIQSMSKDVHMVSRDPTKQRELIARLEHENAVLAATNKRLYEKIAMMEHDLFLMRQRAAQMRAKIEAVERTTLLKRWVVAGISPRAAVLLGPQKTLKLVRDGSIIDGAKVIALRPSRGEVVTSRGILHAGPAS
ncbi:MAG: hypothetical protein ACYDHY_12930 [Acidiferrobacterales bacterium]